MNDKKFICPACETIVTRKDIENRIVNFGMGMCECEFLAVDPDTGETIFPRILHEYIPYNEYRIEKLENIAKELYIENSEWDNVLEMLPKKELKELLDLYDQEKNIDRECLFEVKK